MKAIGQKMTNKITSDMPLLRNNSLLPCVFRHNNQIKLTDLNLNLNIINLIYIQKSETII